MRENERTPSARATGAEDRGSRGSDWAVGTRGETTPSRRALRQTLWPEHVRGEVAEGAQRVQGQHRGP